MFVTSQVTNLQDALAALAPATLAIVSVDGYDRVGKSYLSESLSRALKLRHIELDDLLGTDGGVDVQRLKEAVLGSGASGETGVIVNGVLVLNELAAAGLAPTHRIYVKALNQRGDWVHAGWSAASDEEIRYAREQGMPIGTVYPSSLIAKCAVYHRQHQPHLSADSVFENAIW